MEESYTGRKVLIMGLGLFGGGAEAAKFFAEQGAIVRVTDMKDEAVLAPSLEALEGIQAEFILGRHREEDFRWADTVVVNPAVPPDSPFLQVAISHGASLESEINLLFKLADCPVVGVTGSNGKSTTTALIGAMLAEENPRTLVGGNIGRPLLRTVRSERPERIVVELSSFQLDMLGKIKKSPGVAVVTNISPNHLDWHKTFDDYKRCKQNILASQTADDFAVLNYDDPEVRSWAGLTKGKVFFYSTTAEIENGAYFKDGKLIVDIDNTIVGFNRDTLPLVGMHNVSNALAALLVATVFNVSVAKLGAALAGFRALPHRLELVRESGGVRFYDDSIATTPESAIAALNSFDTPVVLIAGGYDKGVSFVGLAEAARKAKAVVLLGDTARKIADEIKKAGEPADVIMAANFEEGITKAAGAACPGDSVVLSPACASYDMFNNFAERGVRFKELVARL